VRKKKGGKRTYKVHAQIAPERVLIDRGKKGRLSSTFVGKEKGEEAHIYQVGREIKMPSLQGGGKEKGKGGDAVFFLSPLPRKKKRGKRVEHRTAASANGGHQKHKGGRSGGRGGGKPLVSLLLS